MERAVTLFPQPDSPITPSDFVASTVEGHAVDSASPLGRCGTLSGGVYGQQWLAVFGVVTPRSPAAVPFTAFSTLARGSIASRIPSRSALNPVTTA